MKFNLSQKTKEILQTMRRHPNISLLAIIVLGYAIFFIFPWGCKYKKVNKYTYVSDFEWGLSKNSYSCNKNDKSEIFEIEKKEKIVDGEQENHLVMLDSHKFADITYEYDKNNFYIPELLKLDTKECKPGENNHKLRLKKFKLYFYKTARKKTSSKDPTSGLYIYKRKLKEVDLCRMLIKKEGRREAEKYAIPSSCIYKDEKLGHYIIRVPRFKNNRKQLKYFCYDFVSGKSYVTQYKNRGTKKTQRTRVNLMTKQEKLYRKYGQKLLRQNGKKKLVFYINHMDYNKFYMYSPYALNLYDYKLEKNSKRFYSKDEDYCTSYANTFSVKIYYTFVYQIKKFYYDDQLINQTSTSDGKVRKPLKFTGLKLDAKDTVSGKKETVTSYEDMLQKLGITEKDLK
ncbi:hypothetical protein SAMN04487761_13810 [Lachnospiraceae bacterium C7]|nr:hypothetical protein SAMN04487761_13810 [Lachnospiraceae bacterium C7]